MTGYSIIGTKMGLFLAIQFTRILRICSECSLTLQLYRSSSNTHSNRQTDTHTYQKTTIILCSYAWINNNSLLISKDLNIILHTNLFTKMHGHNIIVSAKWLNGIHKMISLVFTQTIVLLCIAKNIFFKA